MITCSTTGHLLVEDPEDFGEHVARYCPSCHRTVVFTSVFGRYGQLHYVQGNWVGRELSCCDRDQVYIGN